jgi:hypothetical protein
VPDEFVVFARRIIPGVLIPDVVRQVPPRIRQIHAPGGAHLPQVGKTDRGAGGLTGFAQRRQQDPDQDGDDSDDDEQLNQRKPPAGAIDAG